MTHQERAAEIHRAKQALIEAYDRGNPADILNCLNRVSSLKEADRLTRELVTGHPAWVPGVMLFVLVAMLVLAAVFR